jgi:alkylresorcinol/alkylpyrone synthase
LNLMGFRPDVKRLPITELGCAAGAMALRQAWEFLRAFPSRTALAVAVELPSLTFQRKDGSAANLISSVLFGDGAAAVAVTARPAAGPRILGAQTHTFPRSLDAMGFDLRDSGCYILLSKDVPLMIQQKIRGVVEQFLARHGLVLDCIAAFILHPGGPKLMSCLEEELGIGGGSLGFLGMCSGNMETSRARRFSSSFRSG